MRQHAMRSLSLVAITLALPWWVEAAELSSQPNDRVRFEPKLTLDIKAKSMVGPSIQLDEKNIAHVAWMEEKENARTLHYARTVLSGEALSSPIAVNAQDEVPYWRQEAPALEAHGEQIYLVWAKMPTQTPVDKPFANELRLSRSLDGGQTFLPSALINDDGELVNHSFDSIRIGREGAIHVAWIDGRGGKKTSGTYVTRSNDHGATFEKNTKIDDETCVCCRTSVAVSPDGTVYVAWRKMFGDIRETVVARSFDGGATFSEPVVVGNDRWVYPSCPHRPASLGVDGDGRVYVSWYTEGEDETPAVYLAYSDDHAQTFSPKHQLNRSKGTFPDHPQLAVDRRGRVVAIWEELSPVRREVVVSHSLDHGQTFSPPYKVNEKKGETPTVAVSPTGQFILAWKEHAMPAHRMVLQRITLPEPSAVALREHTP
ncbi:MAG TPA: sialidase family protein [Nitrospiraceae bacterium]|nr:sialidase family protein [Nitrospiraceae bacterium]